MAISYVSNALGSTSSTTSFSLTLPTTQAGDIIILEFCHRGTGDGTIAGTYTGPAMRLKHSQLFSSSTFSGKTYWSRATGNHSGQTVTGASLTNSCAAIVTIYRGAVTVGDPLSDATVVGEQNASGNETQAEITTARNGAFVVLVVANSPDEAVSSQACTSPGTLTERAEVLSTGGTDAAISHASAEKTTAGATGAFTWAQADQVSGSWAYAIKPHVDADVVRLGSQFFQSGTQATTHALTIPSEADAIVVVLTGLTTASNSGPLLDRLNFNAGTTVDFTQIAQALYGDGFNATQVDSYLMLKSSASWPGTGSQTLTIRAADNPGEGLNRLVIYFKTVDQSSPIVGTASHTGIDDGTSFTSAISSVGAHDAGVVVAYNFNNAGGGPSVAIGTQAQIVRAVAFDSADIAVADKLGSGVLQATASELVAVAFVLKALAASDLAGQANGTATGAGALSADRALAGQASGTSATTGHVSAERSVVGMSAGAATAAGSLSVDRALTGQASGSASTAGVLSPDRELAGQANGSASASGGLRGDFSLAATAPGSSTASGALRVDVALDGYAQGGSEAGSTLAVERRFVGTASGSTSAVGSLSLGLALSGQTDGQSSAAGALSTEHEVNLAGQVDGSSSAAGALQRDRWIAGQADGSATAAGDLLRGRGLFGQAEGSSTASADMLLAISLAGQASGSADAEGSLDLDLGLSGIASGISQAMGVLRVQSAGLEGCIVLSVKESGIGCLSGIESGIGYRSNTASGVRFVSSRG